LVCLHISELAVELNVHYSSCSKTVVDVKEDVQGQPCSFQPK